MSSDNPPTLVDLAALDEAGAKSCRCVLPDEGLIPCRACRDLLPLLRGAAPRLLAELRALVAEWEAYARSLREQAEPIKRDPQSALSWQKMELHASVLESNVEQLRALLGEKA